MQFKELSQYLEKLENTTSRNDMVVILAELMKSSDAQEIDKMMYLLQGRVAPIYMPLEFGMADKMILRAMDKSYSLSEGTAVAEFKRLGDIGEVAAYYAATGKGEDKEFSVSEVFTILKSVTETSGTRPAICTVCCSDSGRKYATRIFRYDGAR